MADEKRMMGDYEVTHSIHIGDNEIVMGENMSSETGDFYMVADCVRNDMFMRYENCYVSADFTELAEVFAQRLTEQVQKLKMEQKKITVPKTPFTAEQCTPIKSIDVTNKIIVIKPEVLRPEHRLSVNQLYVVTGGNGARGNARGRAVFCTSLYNKENERFNRSDILGVMQPENLPEWAKMSLSDINAAKIKEQRRKEKER